MYQSIFDLLNSDPVAARNAFFKLIQKDTTDACALYGMGVSFVREDKATEAIRWFRLAIDNGMDDWQLHYFYGLALAENKDYGAAITELHKAARESPQSPALYELLGSLYLQKGLSEKAEAFFLKALSIDNFYLDGYLGLASLLEVNPSDTIIRFAVKILGRDEKKIIKLAEAFEDAQYFELTIGLLQYSLLIRQSGAVHMKLAMLYWENEINTAYIETEFALAMQYAPSNAAVYQKYTDYMLFSGKVDEAIKVLQQARKTGYSYITVTNCLGMCSIMNGRHQEAIAYFEEIARLEPAQYTAYCNLAQVYRFMGNADKVMYNANKVLVLGEGGHLNKEWLGWACHVLGKLDESINAYEEYLQEDEPEQKAFLDFARVLLKTGQYKKGQLCCREWEKHYPDDAFINFYKGVFYCDGGKRADGIAFYKAFEKSLPASGVPEGYFEVLYYNLGGALLDEKKYEEAKHYFEKCLGRNPESGAAYYGLGEVAYYHEDYQAAKSWYEKALFYNQSGVAVFLGLAAIPYEYNAFRLHHFFKGVFECELTSTYKEIPEIFKLSLDFETPLITYRYGNALFEKGQYDIVYEYKQRYREAEQQSRPFRQLVRIWQLSPLRSVKMLLSEAIIYFYLGDPVSSYLLFINGILEKNRALNAMGWFYFLLSANMILQNPGEVQQKALLFAQGLATGNYPVSAKDKYYAALVLHQCGQTAEAIQLLEKIFPGFMPAGYCLAELYLVMSTTINAESNRGTTLAEKRTALLVRLQTLELGTKPSFLMGINTVYPRVDHHFFLNDIDQVLYFLEQQYTISGLLFKPLELYGEFRRAIVLDKVLYKDEGASLAVERKRAWREFVTRDLPAELVRRYTDGFCSMGDFAVEKMAAEIFDGTRREREELKANEQSIPFNYKIYIAILDSLIAEKLLTVSEGNNLLLYIKYCISKLPLNADNKIVDQIKDEVLDRLTDPDFWAGFQGPSAVKSVFKFILAVYKTTVKQQGPLLTYTAFVKDLASAGDE